MRPRTLDFELIATEARLAHLAIDSAVPGADVLVDGTLVGRTPLPASLAVAPGTRVVTLRRKGYREARRELVLAEGATGKLHIDLEDDPEASLADKGVLALQVRETEVHVAVNGRARGVYSGPLTLPAGPYRLRIERAGFAPSERDVELRAGGETTIRITLDPTPETRVAHLERVQERQRWGWLATGAGLALALGGGGLALWSQQSLPELERRLDEAARNFSLGSGGDCDMATPLGSMREICQARYDEADSAALESHVAAQPQRGGRGRRAGRGRDRSLPAADQRRSPPVRPPAAPAPALTFVPSTWIDRVERRRRAPVRF